MEPAFLLDSEIAVGEERPLFIHHVKGNFTSELQGPCVPHVSGGAQSSVLWYWWLTCGGGTNKQAHSN